MLLAEGKPGPEGSDGGGGSCTMFMDGMGGGGGRAFSEEEEELGEKNLLFVLRLRRREEAKCSRGASAYYRKVWGKDCKSRKSKEETRTGLSVKWSKASEEKNQQRSFVRRQRGKGQSRLSL